MVTVLLTILGVILFFGILRVISRPRSGFWSNFLGICWLDLLIDLVGGIFENLDDFTD
jgi:hypothetical protein